MVQVIKLLALAFLLSSCASWHCRKCKELGGISVDSVLVPIAINVPEAKADTTLSWSNLLGHITDPQLQRLIDSLSNARPDMLPADTIVKENERVKMKIIRGKTVRVECDCKPTIVRDTVTQKKYYTITPKTGINPVRHKLALIGTGIAVSAFWVLVFWLFGRRKD